MSPPAQDVLAFESLLGNTKYEAVPAGMADEVIRERKRRARKWVFYRVVGVLVLAAILGAVLFRFLRDLPVAGGVAVVVALVGSVAQLGARDEGVPEVAAREISPEEVQREYGIDPADPEEGDDVVVDV